MKRPATATIVVFVGILLVVAVIVGVVWTTTDGASAIQVGDARISRQDFNDELREWSQLGTTEVLTTPGAVDSTAGTAIATRAVWGELVGQYLDRVGAPVTADDRQEIITAGGSELRQAPKWFQDLVVDREASFVTFSRVIGDATGAEQERVLRREAQRTGVTVDAAYGRWAPAQLAVVPFFAPVANDQG